MRLLLDTHVALWWALDDRRLGRAARRAIAEAGDAYLSAASIWEMAIKVRLRKLELVRFDESHLGTLASRLGLLDLPITAVHAAFVATLPLHHSDPFDRLLVAQASMEDLVLVTADSTFAMYGLPVLDARWRP